MCAHYMGCDNPPKYWYVDFSGFKHNARIRPVCAEHVDYFFEPMYKALTREEAELWVAKQAL